jgi:hypothetical protein
VDKIWYTTFAQCSWVSVSYVEMRAGVLGKIRRHSRVNLATLWHTWIVCVLHHGVQGTRWHTVLSVCLSVPSQFNFRKSRPVFTHPVWRVAASTALSYFALRKVSTTKMADAQDKQNQDMCHTVLTMMPAERHHYVHAPTRTEVVKKKCACTQPVTDRSWQNSASECVDCVRCSSFDVRD